MTNAEERVGLVREFRYFLLHEKKWWLLPIVVAAVVAGVFLLVTANLNTGSFTYDLY